MTAAILLPGLLFLMLAGLNYSIEFTGGTLVQIRSQKPVDVAQLRSGLDQQGIHGAEIQGFGAPNEYVIRARVAKPGTDANDTQATAAAVSHALDAVLGQGSYTVRPHRGGRPQGRRRAPAEGFPGDLPLLLRGAGLSGVPVRVALRPGGGDRDRARHSGHHRLHRRDAAGGEPHVVAAVLSMVGYSLNDTIIIFDRVREDLKKHKKDRFETVLNRAINETLPRSVLTHGTTLATLLALAVFGGEVIRPFALVMFFGVFTGTFSSIYIASPVLMAIEQRWPGRAARGHMGTTPTPRLRRRRKPQPVAAGA